MNAKLGACVAGVLMLAPGAASADCKLLQLAEFHVDPHWRSPIVDGAVNGQPVKVLLDTGATTSIVQRRAASQLGLSFFVVPGMRLYGIGGDTAVYETHIKEFKVGDLVKPDLNLEVGGDADRGFEASVILGYDFLAKVSVEFDLAHNAVRLFRHEGCTPPQLIYWGAAYSQAQMLDEDKQAPSIQTFAEVNGKRVLAELDSGAGTTVIDTAAAAVAGVQRPTDVATERMQGLGVQLQDSWTGKFDSFALGDEKISNVKMQVLNMATKMTYSETGSLIPRQLNSTPGMFVGADFFRAHRIMIDPEDHLILFSYVGGPVFVTPQPTSVAPNKK
ncbi:MAG TPA: aspartyl protease family protein [Caulobacteraceae bacterium]